jgi:hypothetical protein
MSNQRAPLRVSQLRAGRVNSLFDDCGDFCGDSATILSVTDRQRDQRTPMFMRL